MNIAIKHTRTDVYGNLVIYTYASLRVIFQSKNAVLALKNYIEKHCANNGSRYIFGQDDFFHFQTHQPKSLELTYAVSSLRVIFKTKNAVLSFKNCIEKLSANKCSRYIFGQDDFFQYQTHQPKTLELTYAVSSLRVIFKTKNAVLSFKNCIEKLSANNGSRYIFGKDDFFHFQTQQPKTLELTYAVSSLRVIFQSKNAVLALKNCIEKPI